MSFASTLSNPDSNATPVATGILVRRDTCRLCSSRSLDKVLSLTSTPPANAYVRAENLGQPQQYFPLDLFFCQGCGHVQLLDIVNPETLFGEYLYVSGTSPSFVRHFGEYADDLTTRVKFKPDSMVVDIGSNDGTMLHFFQQRGIKVLGIDPARNLAQTATQRGIETLPMFFDSSLAREIRKDRGPATLITANNVFAHADDLHDLVSGVRELLSPDGLFSFEVSYLADVCEKTLFDTIYHEHLSYHTVGPLISFFHRHDLELIDTVRIGAHGGSLRGIVQHRGGPHVMDTSVTQLLKHERQLGVDKQETLIRFGNRIDAVRQELVSLVVALKSGGKSIAAYGAPAKATTLMHHFQLGREAVDFVVDDNPLKQGWFTPGHHIPILSPDIIYQRRPDYLLVLAWNFANSIMANHARYAADGGRFIVPLPQIIVR